MSMDRDQPELDTGRGSTYQNFYNQIHSEHNAIKNAYEEAKRSLAADNFDAALGICKQYISKYPNHALFQALKFDVEERQRRTLSAVIADTDRRIEAEPDLDRRLGILEEVVRLYPQEAHFERSIRLVRDKRDLVNSIVEKARFFEERGNFVEALDQWQILRSIHERQPGLAFEIERLAKRRDQQARERAKARWVEQSDKHLEAGDYERARKTVETALVEFPGEPEILELDKLVRKHLERAGQAQALLGQAREQAEKGLIDEALQTLRGAFQVDARSAVIRTVLINTLLEKAQRATESGVDGAEADAAIQEVLRLEPNHATARSLASRIEDVKRDDFVASSLSTARRMQTDGDIESAISVIAHGLASYPNEARLLQLQATLERAKTGLRTAELASPAPPDPPNTQGPASQILTVQMLPGELDTLASTPPPIPPNPTTPSPSARKWMVYGSLATLALAVVIAAGVVALRQKTGTPSPQPGKFKILLRSSPQGAQISVAGTQCGISTCEMQLAPGTYRAEARLPGYQPAMATFDVKADGTSSAEIALTLLTSSAQLSVATDLGQGSIAIDGAVPSEIQAGEATVASLGPGKHTLILESGSSHASFAIQVEADAVPRLDGAIETKNLKGFVVTRSASEARLYGSVDGVGVTLDGKPVGALSAGGLELKNLAAGSHELLIEELSKERHKLVFDAGPSMAIFASMLADPDLGLLRIVTGEDGVTVYINGEKNKRTTTAGRVAIYLPPKKYTIRVEKSGLTSPPEQTAELRKGEETQLDFKMTAKRSTLSVHHGVPGSEVYVDGNNIGIVRVDGEFSAAYIVPGKHTVAVKHDKYEPFQADVTFVEGQVVDFDAALKLPTGTLRIDVNPANLNVRLRLRREGESQMRDVTDRNLNLPEGSYTVVASAPRFQDASATVDVVAKRSATASLTLKPVEGAPASLPGKPATTETVSQPTFVLNDWLKLPGWTRENDAAVHQGGDLLLAPFELKRGTLAFTVTSLRGKRIEWVLGYRDEKNYTLFQVEDKAFHRFEVVNGKRTEFKASHDFDRNRPLAFSIAIGPAGVVHRVLRNPEWNVIDDWKDGGAAEGRFGFRVQGRDKIGLTDFRFVPAQ